MELTVLENKEKRIKFELEGEEHSLCNFLRKELWNDKNVEIAGYKIDHNLISEPTFTVEVGNGSAKKTLLDAVARLKKTVKEMKDKSKVL